MRQNRDEILMKAKDSYELRARVKIDRKKRYSNLFKSVFFCCCRISMTETDYAYKKAQQKLASELDIKRILNSIRLFRVALKFLTTPTQRKLLRMQAANNVVEVDVEEYESLKKPLAKKDLHDLLKEHGESSAYSSHDALEFISTLEYEKGKPPEENELDLIRGILPPNDRETQGVSPRNNRLFGQEKIWEEEQ